MHIFYFILLYLQYLDYVIKYEKESKVRSDRSDFEMSVHRWHLRLTKMTHTYA